MTGQEEWHFTTCPACQCNGHSTCNVTGPGLGVCEQPCEDNTQGEHCERCSDGYYGNPVNGGNCSKCDCNGQGTLCDHRFENDYLNFAVLLTNWKTFPDFLFRIAIRVIGFFLAICTARFKILALDRHFFFLPHFFGHLRASF